MKFVTVPFTDFSAENWEALVRDSTNPENTSWDEVEMLMLWNVYWDTTHTLRNYVDQVLNGAINHYNGALTTAYNRIATLETEVICLQGELTRLPGGNIASKAKVPEPPTFADSENKMHLHDWLSQIALYCLVSGITADDQKIMCALTRLCTPASTYMKLYYDKVQAGQGIGSWGDFAQKLKNIYGQRDDKEGAKKKLMALWVNKDLAKKNFVKYAEQYRTLARIVNYSDEVHIDKMKKVIPDEL